MSTALKVAGPGWNSLTAPDYELVFNSDWPSLQIAFETTFTLNPGQSKTINHNLGFIPLVMTWVTIAGTNYGRVAGGGATVTDSQLLFYNASVASYTLTARCFNIDITKEAQYPLPISAATASPPDLTSGIKIVKQNPTRNIRSTNLNDFILNSQAQSPAILTVATTAGKYFNSSNNTINIPLQTSYVPFFTGAIQTGNNPTTYQFYSVNAVQLNGNTLSVNTQGQTTSFIILRDPLIYPNVIKFTF